MAHPATSKVSRTQTTAPATKAAHGVGEAKANRSKSGTQAFLGSSNPLARSGTMAHGGGRAAMGATAPRGGGGAGRISKAQQALLERLGQMDLDPPHYDEIIAKND